MSGARDRRRQREPVGRRDRARRAARRPRRRGRALRDLDEGRRHRRARLGRAPERVHGADAGGSSSAATPARRSATRSTRRGSTSRGAVAGLGADCVEKELRAEHRAELARAARARRDRRRRPGRVPPLRLGAAALQLHDRQRERLLMGWHAGPARVVPLRPQRDRRDPARRARGHLRHPRLRRQAARAALRRPAPPRREHLALPARGLPRALRHRRRARHAASRRSRSS